MSGLTDPDLFLSGNALSQLGLEGSAGGIEDELGGEVGADGLGLLGRVESDGGLVQGEAVNFGVEVKLARGWSRGGSDGAAGRLDGAAGWGRGNNLFVSGNVEEVVKSRASDRSSSADSIRGSWPGADAGLVLNWGSLFLGPLLPGPGRIWDL